VAPGAVVLSSTDTVPALVSLATIRSGLPSRLTSAMVTATGCNPVPNGWATANDGVVTPGAVVFNSTDTVLSPKLATARSGLPSPFKSPTATTIGRLPTAISVAALRVTGAPTTLTIPVSCT